METGGDELDGVGAFAAAPGHAPSGSHAKRRMLVGLEKRIERDLADRADVGDRKSSGGRSRGSVDFGPGKLIPRIVHLGADLRGERGRADSFVGLARAIRVGGRARPGDSATSAGGLDECPVSPDVYGLDQPARGIHDRTARTSFPGADVVVEQFGVFGIDPSTAGGDFRGKACGVADERDRDFVGRCADPTDRERGAAANGSIENDDRPVAGLGASSFGTTFDATALVDRIGCHVTWIGPVFPAIKPEDEFRGGALRFVANAVIRGDEMARADEKTGAESRRGLVSKGFFRTESPGLPESGPLQPITSVVGFGDSVLVDDESGAVGRTSECGADDVVGFPVARGFRSCGGVRRVPFEFEGAVRGIRSRGRVGSPNGNGIRTADAKEQHLRDEKPGETSHLQPPRARVDESWRRVVP